MLLNENESYLVLVAKQILLLTINNVYWYNTRNNISLSIHCARNDIRLISVAHYFRVEINILHGPSMFDKHRKKDVKTLRRKFMECYIIKPAQSLLMKHLVIGQR